MNKSPSMFLGRSVIITGAGSGIGRAMALAFAKEGAMVVVGDVIEQRAVETSREIIALNGTSISVVGDISNPEYSQQLVKRAQGEFGRLDIVCNNAGISDGLATVDEMPIETWQRVLNVNLTGPFLLSRAALPVMLSAQRGVIINTASVSGLISMSGPAYSASKHGVIALTQSIAATYAQDGIRCVAICPGIVKTTIPTRKDELTGRAKRRHESKRRPPPMPPEQIANVALFLASDLASHINGASIVVDDGLLVT